VAPRLDVRALDLLERPQHVVRRLRAVGGVLLQQVHDQRGDRGGRGRPPPGDRLRRLGGVGGEELAGVAPVERRAAGEHLVEDNAERVQVGAVVDGVPRRLLRRHVCRRA
jgi:hypothetical protein